jgi:hypothetical protein
MGDNFSISLRDTEFPLSDFSISAPTSIRLARRRQC